GPFEPSAAPALLRKVPYRLLEEAFMRAPFIPLISTLILSTGFLSAQPARACLSFDFAAEIVALDQALANTRLSPVEASRVQELREQALQADREARRLNGVAGNYRAVIEAMSQRDHKMFDALDKLGLKPIVMPHIRSQDRSEGPIVKSAANPLPTC